MLHSLEMILLLAPFSLHSFFVISHFIQWHRANAFCGVCDKVVHFIWPQSLVGSLAHFSVHFGSCLFVFIIIFFFQIMPLLSWSQLNSPSCFLSFQLLYCALLIASSSVASFILRSSLPLCQWPRFFLSCNVYLSPQSWKQCQQQQNSKCVNFRHLNLWSCRGVFIFLPTTTTTKFEAMSTCGRQWRPVTLTVPRVTVLSYLGSIWLSFE